ncbi:hypothetical protein GDO81_002289 [Engystomops pustulosus]|uniref:Secreted protein n=1 Tax=Engystomops pustulosus TaxID=76066 RepID=A0AAV7DIX9_ENGPU|nr:hypothetical protein GDO81_002289 [Engystomops pustulosus]
MVLTSCRVAVSSLRVSSSRFFLCLASSSWRVDKRDASLALAALFRRDPCFMRIPLKLRFRISHLYAGSVISCWWSEWNLLVTSFSSERQSWSCRRDSLSRQLKGERLPGKRERVQVTGA